MSYLTTIRRYLRDLQNEYQSALRGGQHTAELSYRPVLDALFRGLAKDLCPNGNIDIVLEPRNQGKVGRPDWRIHDSISLGIYGYIEAKGLTETLFDITPYQSQIDRYLTLGHKLVITDGIEFVFCMQKSTNPVVISLINKNEFSVSDWSCIQPNPQFELFMRQFFANPSPQQCDEAKLVELVALRTRLLADDIMHYAAILIDEALNDEESQAIELLSGIRELIYNHNDNHLRTDKVFADFTAQVIMFCLLYAHRVFCDSLDSPTEKEIKIRKYIYEDLTEGETLLPFRNLMVYLRDHAETGIFITQWVDECIKFLSFVQMTDYQLMNPDYHQLFELFLAKYDPQTRFDYGAYYTPKILADFVVKVTEQVVHDSFDGASIYDNGNTLVDPCCGTGSFLEEIIKHDKKDGAYNLCGFEIMPAPYMLANYRMAIVRKQIGQRNHSTNIILANTLSNCVFDGMANDSSIEGHELNRANELAALPLKLIIGNPPCSDSNRQNTSEDFSTINDLMDDFRPPMEVRRGRQNIQKQVNNPYMQFLRWSCEKLLNSPNHSVLAFVVPSSFLEAESYRYARKYMVEHFSEAWIVAVDADARTGIRSDSLFRTLQGRAVIILTHKYSEKSGITQYHFADFSHNNMAKKEKLLTANIDRVMSEFDIYSVPLDTYAFFPAKPFNEELYNRFWPVSGENGEKAIFQQHCSGIKLAPTAMFTHVKAPILKRRSKDIATGGSVSADEWFSKQDRPPKTEKTTAFQTALKECGDAYSIDALLTENITAYSFRPFLTSNVLLWKELLQSYTKVGGGGTRLRKEIIAAYENTNTIGFAMAHAPKDLNPTLSQFVSFCWYYPDNDMCTRGNSHIYMNQYLDKNSGIIQNNVDLELLHAISVMLNVSENESAKEMVYYTYAVLCSQVYLDEFEGALFTVNQSDKRARIPIVNDANIFIKIAEIGKRIAELEKKDYKPDNILGFDYDALSDEIPKNFHLKNSVHPFNEEEELLILSDGNTEIKIPCPLALQQLNISGYDVIKNVWLKFNSYDFTHCAFNTSDMASLLNLLNTLSVHAQLVGEIDGIVYKIITKEYKLIQP